MEPNPAGMNEPESNAELLRLNVGCGRDIQAGWVNIDHADLPGVDISFDLERCGELRLPFEDDSVGEIRLFHVIEHIHNVLPLMEELYRVASNGCLCTVRVPHGASDDAWTDPTHLRPYFRGSFGYFSQPQYWRADYGYRGDWQPEKILLMVNQKKFGHMDGKALLYAVSHERNIVHEIITELRAIKPARPQSKEHMTRSEITVQMFK